jgi:hypothetical protein
MNADCLRTREKLEDTNYILYLTPARGDVILYDNELKRYELWTRCDGYAGYTIIYGGVDYEFVCGSPDLSAILDDTN